MLKNSIDKYGLISRLFHWFSALAVFSLFGLGIWMVELDYYSSWYKTGPDIHRSIGILLAIATLFRLLWITVSTKPNAVSNTNRLEKLVANIMHISLYIILFVLFTSGYLISTADGRAIDVFTWFSVPSLGEFITNQEDIAGEIHEWLAYVLISLVGVHALAALKHHFINKDNTLRRML